MGKNVYVKLLSAIVIFTLLMSTFVVTITVVNATGTTYYVDYVNGNDSNNGTSTSTPWKTLTKVNGITFVAGDKILFKAGCSWTGMLYPKGSGASGSPIAIDMYGAGNKPIINGGGVEMPSAALKLANQSYWDVKNLEITNDASSEAYRAGILVRSNNGTTNNYLHFSNLYIHNVKGSNTWGAGKSTGGIIIDSMESLGTKYNDVLVENCSFLTTDRLAINIGWVADGANGQSSYYNTNVVIRNNVMEDIGGDSIMVCHCVSPLVEYNVSKSGNIRSSTRSTQDGFACAMWPWSCNDALFQYNEGYGEKWNEAEYIEYGIGEDGTAFDVDGYNYTSVHQYNYSHDNQGGFIMICASSTDDKSNNTIIRYNISQNDGHDIFDIAGPSTNSYIYNNVIYTQAGMTVMTYNFRNRGGIHDNCQNYNNIFYNLGTAEYVWGGSTNNVFDYNVFYGSHPATEPSDAHKLTSNPNFVSAGSGGDGIDTVTGYQLQSNSSCINSGMTIGTLGGEDNGGQDFWGNTLYNGAADRGVHEYTGTIPTNLILNPGFESGVTNWTIDYGNASAVTGNANSGSYSLRVGTASGGRAQDVTTGVVAGHSYTFSAWVKAASGADGYIGIDCLNSSGTVIQGSIVEFTVTNTSYAQQSTTFTAPTGTAKLQVYITNGSGYVYADDLLLTDTQTNTNTPTPTNTNTPTPTNTNTPTPTNTNTPTPTSTPISSNLILNPGFESGVTNWTINYGNNSAVTGNAHSGTYSLRVGTASGGRAQDVTAGVVAGASYTFSAWAKVASGADGYTGIDCLDSSGTVIQGSIVEFTVTNTSYAQQSTTFTTPTGTAKLQVYITNGSGYVYADDLSLTAN